MNASKPVVGVVGAGTMGRGIAQLFAEAGHEVRLCDTVEGAASRGCDFIAELLRRSVERQRITPRRR